MFPGGSIDDTDGSPIHAALRETYCKRSVSTPIIRDRDRPARHDAHLRVGIAGSPGRRVGESRPKPHPNPAEVAEVLEIPLDEFDRSRSGTSPASFTPASPIRPRPGCGATSDLWESRLAYCDFCLNDSARRDWSRCRARPFRYRPPATADVGRRDVGGPSRQTPMPSPTPTLQAPPADAFQTAGAIIAIRFLRGCAILGYRIIRGGRGL